MGWVIYKSIDAGKSWQRMGLEKTGRIGRIVIDPRNPNSVIAAALGHTYTPQEERGLYRTTDGGKTWTRVLFADPNSGGIDLVMDPNAPDILFAATCRSKCIPMDDRAAVRAAASGRRETAERRGRKSPATAYPRGHTEKSGWR